MDSANTTKIRNNKKVLLATILVLNLVFFIEVAMPYLLWRSYKMELFLGREVWVFTHVSMGVIALLAGPIQFWLAWRSKFISHKRSGMIYMIAVGISGMASFYLAFANQTSWIFGLGLGVLGIAWWLTTGLAFLAIRRHKIQLHREWMTRSFILTMGFIFFRLFIAITTYLEIGSPTARLEVGSWFCWAFPLLIGEIFIQRKGVRNEQAHLYYDGPAQNRIP